MDAPRFAVDKMLGRLATWLRIIGVDASYGSHLAGRPLTRHARREGRTILSRDHRLLKETDLPPFLFIDSDDFRDQLRQVVLTFSLDPFACLFTRCTQCNEPITAVPKAELAAEVPPYVFATQDHFVRCPRCRRVYWPATHHQHVRDELRRLGFQPPA
jgi:uncharacterized protein